MAEQEPIPVLSVLSAQHEQVRTLLERVRASQGQPARSVAFRQLRYLLAAHEAAEEEQLHPLAAHTPGADDDVVAARLREENQASEAIAELEQLDVDSEQFTTQFTAFQRSVIAHAEAEERQELPPALAQLDDEQQRLILQVLAQVPQLAQPDSGPLTGGGDSFAALLHAAREHFHNQARPQNGEHDNGL